MDKQTQSPWFTKTQRLETGTDLKSSLTTVQHSGPPSKEQQKKLQPLPSMSCIYTNRCKSPLYSKYYWVFKLQEWSKCSVSFSVNTMTEMDTSVHKKKKNNLQGVEIIFGCIFAIERNLERIGFFVSLLFIFCSISFYAKTTVYWIIKVFPNSRCKTERPYFWDGKKKKNAVYSLHLDFKKFNQLQTVTDLYRF